MTSTCHIPTCDLTHARGPELEADNGDSFMVHNTGVDFGAPITAGIWENLETGELRKCIDVSGDDDRPDIRPEQLIAAWAWMVTAA